MQHLDNAIAIVGMAVRFPGARNLAEFWRNLVEGKDCGKPLSKEDIAKAGVDKQILNDPNYVFRGYEVDGMDLFDARFFGFSPREASMADPQLRLSLETAYECIEDSCHDLLGKNVGFYFGIADHKYWMYYNLFQTQFEEDNEVAKRILAFKDFFATQISYRLGLTGPSISLSSACSTGMLATHEACNHLLMYDCDYAIAGSCEVVKRIGYKYVEGGLSSRDGYVRAFDKDASGTVFSSGVGAVVLRRLADAIADGDRIYAVIRSTAVNNDGNEKVGYMAPGVKGQMGVINEALVRAGISARDIGYVEAHGTGTNVGDPIELNSLSQVYRKFTPDKQYCAIGSAKTNLGHLSIAAGTAGLIKASLMIYNKKLVPSLHFKTANPAIDFTQSPFYVNTECKAWDANAGSRLVGISSFGVGGTNVHAILGEAPVREKQTHSVDQPRNKLLVLSAKDPSALQTLAGQMATHLQENPATALADLSYTLATGRHAYSHRFHIYADSVEQAAAKFKEASSEGALNVSASPAEELPVVFMFPGQGSQYVNMGRNLGSGENEYRNAIDECAAILKEEFDLDLLAILYSDEADLTAATQLINRTEFTQLSLFVTSYAMAKQWMHWGVLPSAMAGHSIGEYVAACLAGVFGLRDALKLVYHRGRLMQSMAPGSMLSIPLPQPAVQRYLTQKVSVAAVNSPLSCVVSGTRLEIERLQERLMQEGHKTSILRTSHAFHSVMMEPMLDEYLRILRGVALSAPHIPFVSNVSGEWITDAQATSPDYWVSQLRQPVLFAAGAATLCRNGPVIFLEVGPGATLTSLLGQCETQESRLIRTMRQAKDQGDDFSFLYNAVGQYFGAGRCPRWEAFFGPDHGHRIDLPTYPMQRKSYWIDENELRRTEVRSKSEDVLEHPLLGRRIVSSPQVVVFENTLNHCTPGYVSDHRVVETVIFPGAGFTEMALAIGRHFSKNNKKLRVDEIRFANALILHRNLQKTVQIIATARPDGGCSFEILSRNSDQPDEKRNWVLHAKGRISLHSVVPDDYPMPALMHKENSELLPLSRYYDALKFITFGPAFRSVKRMWIGENESLGWCELPEQLLADVGQYLYHPVLLDAAFQVIDGPRISESGTLPVGLKNLTVYDAIPNRFFVHALRVDNSDEEYSIGEMTVFTEQGKVISKIQHYLQKEIADSVEFREQLSDALHEIEWREDQAARTAAVPAQSSWLLVGEPNELTRTIKAQLEEREQRIVLIDDRRYAQADYSSLLRASSFDGIVFARGFDPSSSAYDLSVSLLYLVKALAEAELAKSPRLHIVTSGAQYRPGSEEPVSEHCVQQAALWGVGNTITVEHPELRCVRMDLDESREAIGQLIEDLLSTPVENQIVYRSGKRYVPRLSKFKFQSTAADKLVVPDGPFDVRLNKFGTFDNFTAREFIPDIVNDDEVQIEMHAAALNFKETLYALGLLNPNNRDATDFEFGMEGAGRIKRVGGKVTHLRVGDDVIVWHNGCLRSDFVVNTSRVVRMPSNLNYLQAACIPTVYLTAYYALHNLANIQRGDRVLIHAAAGGVGQVAVQVAQAAGAEVYATASPGKWEHLRSQGITHIYNSRTLDFARQIREDTAGKGVDIVLNSLTGDFIPKSFDVLAPNGRLVEIGKLNIWTTAQATEYRPDVKYRFFEVGENTISGGIGEESPIKDVMVRVLDDLSTGKLGLIPIKEYDLEDLPSAYRYLAAGKNVGKVVIDLCNGRGRDEISDFIKGDRSYLITGGLGGLGLLSAAWLIEKGAKHVALVGRSAPSEDARRKIDDWRKVGVQVAVEQGDIGVREDVARIFDNVRANMPAMGGVLHCAGLLQDGVMARLTERHFQDSFAPKVVGTWNLHELTKDLDLDMFVLFSSVSAIFDGGGQANYAAANAFMDRLAAFRHSQGLPALSVNWGGWADVGMAARLAASRGVHAEHLLNKEEAFLSLERLLVERRIQGVVCKLGDRLSAANVPLFLSELVKSGDSELGSMSEAQRIIASNAGNSLEQNMQLLVRKQVAKVLGVSSEEEIRCEEEFVDLGIDSLSMTELKNAMQTALGKNLKMAVFFANSTVARFAKFLAEQYGAEFGGASGEAESSSFEFVKLVESKAKETLFCVPGMNGNVFDFLTMAEACKERYCLQIAQTATDLDSLETDIVKLAARAIEQIRRIQRTGPYAFVGYSYGGVICLEIASQLRSAGEEVRLLTMIDSFPHFEHAQDRRFVQFMSALIADSVLQPMSLDAVRYAQYAEKIMSSSLEEGAGILAELNREANGTSRLDLALLRDIVTAGEKKWLAHYQPPAAIPGLDIHFVRAGQYPPAMAHAKLEGFLEMASMRDEVYGWKRYVANRFVVTRLDGHHNTLLKKDNVHEVLALVDSVLNGDGPTQRHRIQTPLELSPEYSAV
jgi:acyl transferase domain-containing protein/NADPH:quinone reductase-like Zn-dependent oxidoreductase/thioesterase domain-containing protein/acyl carrier protein